MQILKMAIVRFHGIISKPHRFAIIIILQTFFCLFYILILLYATRDENSIGDGPLLIVIVHIINKYITIAVNEL
jgi:hypothetical protein